MTMVDEDGVHIDMEFELGVARCMCWLFGD